MSHGKNSLFRCILFLKLSRLQALIPEVLFLSATDGIKSEYLFQKGGEGRSKFLFRGRLSTKMEEEK